MKVSILIPLWIALIQPFAWVGFCIFSSNGNYQRYRAAVSIVTTVLFVVGWIGVFVLMHRG